MPKEACPTWEEAKEDVPNLSPVCPLAAVCELGCLMDVQRMERKRRFPEPEVKPKHYSDKPDHHARSIFHRTNRG